MKNNNLIYFPVWQRILMHLQTKKGMENAHKIGLEIGVTYSAMVNTIGQMRQQCFVNVTPLRGRSKDITLTPKGSSLAEALQAVLAH